MREIPTELEYEDPMKSFCEEVQVAEGRATAEREEEIDIIFAIPFEDKQPIIVRTVRDMPKCRLQVLLQELGVPTDGSDQS